MLQVMEQDGGHALHRGAEEDRGAGDARRRHPRELIEERLERHRCAGEQRAHQLAAALPGRQENVDRRRDGEGNPAARADLHQVGAEKREVDREKERRQPARLPDRPAPAPRGQRRRGHLEALDGRKHGDRRCDDPVAVEEGGAEEGEGHHGGSTPARGDEREERQDPAFSAVVGAHHEDDVLHAHDEDQGPDQGREHPEHRGPASRGARGQGAGTRAARTAGSSRCRQRPRRGP